jgi:hypothetical protein
VISTFCSIFLVVILVMLIRIWLEPSNKPTFKGSSKTEVNKSRQARNANILIAAANVSMSEVRKASCIQREPTSAIQRPGLFSLNVR